MWADIEISLTYNGKRVNVSDSVGWGGGVWLHLVPVSGGKGSLTDSKSPESHVYPFSVTGLLIQKREREGERCYTGTDYGGQHVDH